MFLNTKENIYRYTYRCVYFFLCDNAKIHLRSCVLATIGLFVVNSILKRKSRTRGMNKAGNVRQTFIATHTTTAGKQQQ